MDINNIWLNKLYSKQTRLNSDILKTLIYFILPVVIVFAPFLMTRFELILNHDTKIILALSSAALWSFWGPFLINRFFVKLEEFKHDMAKFMIPVDDIIEDEENYDSQIGFNALLNNEFKRLKINILIISIIWGALIVAILIIFRGELVKYGFYGFKDIYFYLLVIYIIFLLHLQAIGFSAIIMSINILRKVAQNVLIIEDILESNEGYGIKLLGDLTLRTTTYFMSGIVYIPILLIFVSNQNDTAKTLINIAIMIFLLFLLGAFLIPNYILWRSAEKQKDNIDSEIRKYYNEKFKNSMKKIEKNSDDMILEELQINNLYNHMQLIDKIRTMPVSLEKIIAIMTSLLVPSLLFLNEIYEVYCSVIEIFSKK